MSPAVCSEIEGYYILIVGFCCRTYSTGAVFSCVSACECAFDDAIAAIGHIYLYAVELRRVEERAFLNGGDALRQAYALKLRAVGECFACHAYDRVCVATLLDGFGNV